MSNISNVQKVNILSLPDEIISLILVHNEPHEIIKFSITCKRFYETVCNNDYLWKIKYSEKVPKAMMQIIKDHRESQWHNEFVYLCKIRKKVYSELLSMSPKFYSRLNGMSMEDIRPFFTIASEGSLNYFYIIYFLQEIIKETNVHLDQCTCSKPLHTMTVMFYAKITLRYMIQTFLTVKWVQMRLNNELSPEKIVTFFVQWIDPTRTYDFDEVELKIQELMDQVLNILKQESDNHKSAKPPTERQILQAISHAIYRHERFSIAFSVKTNNLDVARVIRSSHGNIFTFGAIFQAVAQRFGIDCELKVFPNHLFLDWRNNDESSKPLYTVDLLTGELKQKRQCPFSRKSGFSETKYCPDSLLQYVYTSYMKTKSPIKNCETQNAIFLLDFLGTNQSKHNQYKSFLYFLTQTTNSPAFNIKLNLKYMHESHMQLILALSTMNPPQQDVYHDVLVKSVRKANYPIFAVGMTCYHKLYNYTCVIRDWEPDGSHRPGRARDKLHNGMNQPFYRVIAGDQSERFIAHENLMAVTSPFRIYNLEDHIAKEFTHFEGFYYVPNDEKLAEYPNDIIVAEEFKKKAYYTEGSYIGKPRFHRPYQYQYPYY